MADRQIYTVVPIKRDKGHSLDYVFEGIYDFGAYKGGDFIFYSGGQADWIKNSQFELYHQDDTIRFLDEKIYQAGLLVKQGNREQEAKLRSFENAKKTFMTRYERAYADFDGFLPLIAGSIAIAVQTLTGNVYADMFGGNYFLCKIQGITTLGITARTDTGQFVQGYRFNTCFDGGSKYIFLTLSEANEIFSEFEREKEKELNAVKDKKKMLNEAYKAYKKT
ncbi:MAG: hypothetical protein MJ245_07320 [Clostridia bacterium]|nr:hypothetical protein [Clostridia bacterium]